MGGQLQRHWTMLFGLEIARADRAGGSCPAANTSEDIAGCIFFLGSDEAAYLTGPSTSTAAPPSVAIGAPCIVRGPPGNNQPTREVHINLGLTGRSVLVTGGSAGIGRAIAYAYAAEGASVTLSYHTNEDAAAAIANEIERRGGTAAAVPMNLADRASIEQAVEEAGHRNGGLDVLIANAVRWPTDAAGPLAEADPEVWQAALRANLEGAAATVRAAWPLLHASDQGRIVLISTGVTRHGLPGATAYATAKAGLEGLVAALKWEGGEAGILCNLVAPGFTVTDANLARFPDEARERVRARTPSGRLSTPDDVAPAVLFLGSPANTNITGAYLPVAGGTD